MPAGTQGRSRARPKWVPDSAMANCGSCKARFTIVKRRHHCRRCGNIFCNKCANERKVLHDRYGYGSVPQRQCRTCTIIDVYLMRVQLEESQARTEIVTLCHIYMQSAAIQLIQAFATQVPVAPATVPAPSAQLIGSVSVSPSPSPKVPLNQPLSPAVPSKEGPLRPTLNIGEKDLSIRRDVFTDAPELVTIALGFMHCVTSPEAGLLKDTRVNLKRHENIFQSDQVVSWFETRFKSMDAGVMFEGLRRAGLFEHVADKCYRFSEDTTQRCRDLEAQKQRNTQSDEKPVISVGDAVVTDAEPYKEGFVASIDSKQGHQVTVMYSDSTSDVFEGFHVMRSPFHGVAGAVPKLLFGALFDLDGSVLNLSELRPDLLSRVFQAAKHIQGSILGDHHAHTKKGSFSYVDSFDAHACVGQLSTLFSISSADAVNFGELLLRLHVFEPLEGQPSEFTNTQSAYFRLATQTVKAVEELMEHVKLPLVRDPCVDGFGVGATVFVVLPGGFKGKEGTVVDVVEEGLYMVQFEDGAVWVFGEEELVGSPAVEVLGLAKEPGVELRDPRVRNLVLLFTISLQRHVRDQWSGFSKYKSVFSAEDAITWFTQTFPSLNSQNALEVGDVLRKIGLIIHGSDSEELVAAPFERKHYYRFVEASVKALDELYISGAPCPVTDILKDVEVTGTVRKDKVKPLGKVPTFSEGEDQLSGFGGGFGLEDSLKLSPGVARHRGMSRVPDDVGIPIDGNINDGLAPGRAPRGLSVGNFNSPTGLDPRRQTAHSLPPASFDAYTDAAYDRYLLQRQHNNTWTLLRYVLSVDGMLEIHAPRAKIVSSTRLRSVPEDEGRNIWTEPPTYLAVDDAVTLVSPALDSGYQKVSCQKGKVEGYVRSLNLQPVHALQSSTHKATLSAHESDVRPQAGDVHNADTWRHGMVISSRNIRQHVAVQSRSERTHWLSLLRAD